VLRVRQGALHPRRAVPLQPRSGGDRPSKGQLSAVGCGRAVGAEVDRPQRAEPSDGPSGTRAGNHGDCRRMGPCEGSLGDLRADERQVLCTACGVQARLQLFTVPDTQWQAVAQDGGGTSASRCLAGRRIGRWRARTRGPVCAASAWGGHSR
jgi:hypothetical protein